MKSQKSPAKPKWAWWVEQNIKWAQVSDNILNILFRAREGSKLSAIVGGFSALGHISAILYPNKGLSDSLEERGLKWENKTWIDGFICDTLINHYPHKSIAQDAWSNEVRYCEELEFAAIYSSGQYSAGPYSTDEQRIIQAFRKAVWSKDSNLMITKGKDDDGHRGSNGRYILSPMNKSGAYLGTKDPKWYADRLSRYENEARSILLIGPTGVGKSVLARHIAQNLAKENSRILKIASSIIYDCGLKELQAFIQYLSPTILLIDDLDVGDGKRLDTLLSLLESLRNPECVVIITMMVSMQALEKKRSYFPGMRPGRIDEVFWLDLPDADERKNILLAYLEEGNLIEDTKDILGLLVEKTAGLPGSYLQELIRRIKAHGVPNWEEELERVVLSAPPSKEEGKEATSSDDDNEDEDGISEENLLKLLKDKTKIKRLKDRIKKKRIITTNGIVVEKTENGTIIRSKL